MNKRQKIIVSITGIFIVLLALVGLTYAYFLTQIRGNEETKSISVSTANLILEYTDGNGIITMSNVMPGDPVIEKTFAVTNRGNETVENYNVYLENVQNQLELKDDLIYMLSCRQVKTSDYEVWEQSTDPNKNISDIESVEICGGTGGTKTFPSVMSVIGTNTIEPGYTQYYALKVRYHYKDYDQSIDMNKLVQAKVNIYDGKTKFLSTEIINNTTLNKTNNSTTGTLYTLPNELPTKIAEEINGSDERILSYTLDDLGTSYYYRGNVTDNYVNFAGMCWRIVRIEGDGSVKLILQDKNTLCDDESYTGNWYIGDGNYGYHAYDDNGTNRSIPTFTQPVTNPDKSMVKILYDFQKIFTNDEFSDMKSGNWCLSDKIYARSDEKPYTFTLIEEYDFTRNLVYDSYARLTGEGVDGYKPTYKCNGRILNNFETVINEAGEEIIKEAPMYVSALTADEIVYAGGSRGVVNSDYYLLNKSQEDTPLSFWTLSPYNFMAKRVGYGFYINEPGNLHVTALALDVSIRPTISLKSSMLISTKSDTVTYGQPGTQTNPYVIG